MINDLVATGKCTRNRRQTPTERRRIRTNAGTHTANIEWTKKKEKSGSSSRFTYEIEITDIIFSELLRVRSPATTSRQNGMKNYFCNLFDLLVCWQTRFFFESISQTNLAHRKYETSGTRETADWQHASSLLRALSHHTTPPHTICERKMDSNRFVD